MTKFSLSFSGPYAEEEYSKVLVLRLVAKVTLWQAGGELALFLAKRFFMCRVGGSLLR